MATGGAIVSAVGLGVSLYGDYKRSKAQRKEAEARAESKRIQADKLMERFQQNAEAMRVDTKQFVGQQMAGYAKGGVDVGSGSPALQVASTYNLMLRQLDIEQKEAEDKAELLRMGADIDTRLAGDIKTAGRISAVGSLIGGASQTYSTYKSYSASK